MLVIIPIQFLCVYFVFIRLLNIFQFKIIPFFNASVELGFNRCEKLISYDFYYCFVC